MKKIIYTLFLFPFLLVAQNIDVADGATLLIDTGGTMTISGTLTSNTSGNIIIATSRTASGSLLAVAAGNSQGKGITLRRSLDGSNEWALIGVPVTGETSTDIDDNLRTSGAKSAIGHWDPGSGANGAYVYFNTDSGTSLTNGRGYLISPSASGNVDFTGTMSYATVTYTLEDESGTHGNWNLIGNPFPSFLHMTNDAADATNNFLTVNTAALHDDYQAVYAWDGSEYDVYNQTTDNTNYVAPGEGFFVYSVDGGATVSFTEAMQTSGRGSNFNASIARGTSSKAQKRVSVFKLELKDNIKEEIDITKLYFSNEQEVSKGLDPGYDAGKFFEGSDSRIFTRLVNEDKGTDFHIQALPYSDLSDVVVPLGITTKSSSLQLSIKENSIDHLYSIYLEDKLNNTIVELDQTIDLDFVDNNSNGLGRFYLHFTKGMIPELPTDGDDFRIYKVSESEIRLMGSPETIYNAKIYDFSGRLTKEVNFTHKVNINEIDSKGIKILTIESNDKKIIKKFDIK
tara:strand:+ start:1574 stop:3112 length:1539 start_codon:yes stop_codon:yes gene_type:complete